MAPRVHGAVVALAWVATAAQCLVGCSAPLSGDDMNALVADFKAFKVGRSAWMTGALRCVSARVSIVSCPALPGVAIAAASGLIENHDATSEPHEQTH